MREPIPSEFRSVLRFDVEANVDGVDHDEAVSDPRSVDT
jgi:hypothetical protein